MHFMAFTVRRRTVKMQQLVLQKQKTDSCNSQFWISLTLYRLQNVVAHRLTVSISTVQFFQQLKWIARVFVPLLSTSVKVHFLI